MQGTSNITSGNPGGGVQRGRSKAARVGVRIGLGLTLVCGSVAGVMMLAGAGAAKPQPTAKTSGTSGDRAVVQRQAFDITTTSIGDLEAKNKIEIRNPLDRNSTIVQIAPEGSRAKKGDLLIQLNIDDTLQKIDEESLRLKSAEAELVSAQNSYEIQVIDNQSKLRQAQLKVELAELALRQWVEGDVKKKQQELDLDMNRAELELERLAEKFSRSQELLKEGFISKDECDRDEVAYIEAISAYTTANLARDVYANYEFEKDRKSKQSDVDEAIAERERVRLNNDIELASKAARRDNQQSQVTIIANRVDKYRRDRDNASIIAPADGLVVYGSSVDRNQWGRQEGPLQIGQQVSANQLLMILPDTSVMIAAIRVTESLAGRVRQGQRVTVRVDAAAGAVFEGSVDSIGVMAETGGWRDPNLREYTVRVAIDNPSGLELKPAMRCEARIILDQVAETLVVPVQAVFNDGALTFVYMSEGTKFVRKPVKLGRRSDTVAEIRAGLNASEQVLIRQPAAGEVLVRTWDEAELKAAGFKLAENGQVVAEGRPENGNGGMPPGMNGGGPNPGTANGGGRGQRGGQSQAGGGGGEPSAAANGERARRQRTADGAGNGGNAPRGGGAPDAATKEESKPEGADATKVPAADEKGTGK